MKFTTTIYFLLLFILSSSIMSGCNSEGNNSTQEKTENTEMENPVDSVTQNDEVTNSDSTDLPASKYFSVSNIIKAEYVDDAKFKMEVEILNNTDYKFKNFVLSARITYKMQNEEASCERSAQHDEITPNVIESWQSHTTKTFSFTIDHHGQLGCLKVNYDRTPESIELVLEPFIKAISVDKEVEGPFAIYDLLPQWKERQAKEGLR